MAGVLLACAATTARPNTVWDHHPGHSPASHRTIRPMVWTQAVTTPVLPTRSASPCAWAVMRPSSTPAASAWASLPAGHRQRGRHLAADVCADRSRLRRAAPARPHRRQHTNDDARGFMAPPHFLRWGLSNTCLSSVPCPRPWPATGSCRTDLNSSRRWRQAASRRGEDHRCHPG